MNFKTHTVYPCGSISGVYEGHVRHGKFVKHGRGWQFDLSGTLRTLSNWINDKQFGYRFTYDEKGKLILRESFVGDVLYGTKTIYIDGKVSRTIPYINDKKHGECILYKEQRQYAFILFKNDIKVHARVFQYFENGKVNSFERIHYFTGAHSLIYYEYSFKESEKVDVSDVNRLIDNFEKKIYKGTPFTKIHIYHKVIKTRCLVLMKNMWPYKIFTWMGVINY